MANLIAGRVAFVPKGEYDNATQYEFLDYVYYNNSSYVAKTTTTGNLPTNTDYWQIITDFSSETLTPIVQEIIDDYINGDEVSY